MANPDSIAGLKFWFKADAITALVDGDPLTTWEDSHTTNVDATQATAAKKPLYKTAILNALPVVRFDGVDDVMALATAIALGPDYTLFVVGKAPTGFAASPGLANMDTTNRIFQFRYNSTGTGMEHIGFNTAPAAFTDTQTATATAFNVLTAQRAALVVDTYVNGTSGGSTASTGTNVSTTVDRSLWLGTNFGATNGFLNGDIAEVCLYGSSLSAGDRATVHTYIQDKYGITVSDYVASGFTGWGIPA